MITVRKCVYIETTIPSYLTARPSRDLVTAAHQQVTREWWESHSGRFDLFVSRIVIEEAGRGDHDAPPVICTPDELMGG